MIVDERIVDYIRSLETRNSEILEMIEQEALKERVPIIRKEMQSFLKVLLLLKRPERILDAMEILKTLEEPYDMIFVDAAKAQYIAYFPEVMRLLNKDGMLISDNVLQDGGIMESRFAVERRDRTIHSRMREYLYLLKHDERLETAVVPIGDGASVSVKKE